MTKMEQSRTYIQKNALELKQGQEYSYGVMGNIFSALECDANKSFPNKPSFNCFDIIKISIQEI